MMLKVTILLAFAAVLVQNTSNLAQGDKTAVMSNVIGSYSDQLTLEDDTVGAELDQLKQEVDAAIKQGHTLLDDTNKKLGEAMTKRISEVKKALDDHSKSMVDELEKLKAYATDVKVDTADCLKQEEQLKGLPAAYASKVQECQDGTAKDTNAIVEKFKATVGAFADEVAALKKKRDDCGSGASAAACQAKVDDDIILALYRTPTDVSSAAGQGVWNVYRGRNALEVCLGEVTYEFLDEGQEIVTEVAQCIRDKIPAPTPRPPVTLLPD